MVFVYGGFLTAEQALALRPNFKPDCEHFPKCLKELCSCGQHSSDADEESDQCNACGALFDVYCDCGWLLATEIETLASDLLVTFVGPGENFFVGLRVAETNTSAIPSMDFVEIPFVDPNRAAAKLRNISKDLVSLRYYTNKCDKYYTNAYD